MARMARMVRMADPSGDQIVKRPTGQGPAGPVAAVIRFACGTCKERLVVPYRHAGRKGKCPKCGTINRVPAVSEFDDPAPATPSANTTAPAPAVSPRAAAPHARPFATTKTAPAAAPLTPAPPAPPATAMPAARRAGEGILLRLRRRLRREPPRETADASEAYPDLYDSGGIPPAVKLLFALGVLVLVPLLIGAAFVIMILLRVKLSS